MCSSCCRILFYVIIQKGVKHSMKCACFWCCWNFCLCCCTKVFHLNYFNIHRSISTIVFRIYLVCKNRYHYLGITTTTLQILVYSTEFELFTAIVEKVIGTYNFYVWKVKWKLLYLWNVETCVKVIHRCIHYNKLFSGVYFCGCHRSRIL